MKEKNPAVAAENKAKKSKKPLVALIIVFLVLALAAGGAYCAYRYYETEISGGDRADGLASFTVKNGEAYSTVGKRLEEEGFIGSELVFKIYLRLNPPTVELKAGEFHISPAMSYYDIIMTLSSKPVQYVHSVTVPDGKTQKEILAILSESSGHTPAELLAAIDSVKNDYPFLKNLPDRPEMYEGYLYPDTYEFFNDESAEGTVRKILDNFAAKLEAYGVPALLEQSSLSLDEAVTLAAVIQGETPHLNEAKTVSGVLWNRLKTHMKLQCDITVYYALGKSKGQELSLKDLQVESPYNTYYCDGLPLCPISNVRIEYIVAALSPEDTDYFYFIYADGRTIYAKTLEEHNKNVDKYLRR